MKVKKNVIKLSALALAGFISLGSTNIVTLANSVDPIEHNEQVDERDDIFDANKYYKDYSAEDGAKINYIGNAVVLKHNAKYRNYSYSDIDELYKQAQLEREFRIFGNLQLTENLTEVPEEVDSYDPILNNVNLVIRDSEGNIIFDQTLNELLGMINNGYISINTVEDSDFTYEFTLSSFADEDTLEWDLDLSRVFSEIVRDGDDNILKLYILLAPKGMTEEDAFPDFNDMWDIDKIYDDNQDDSDIFDFDKEDLNDAADLIREEKEKEIKSEVNLKTLEERIAELKEQIIKLQEKIDALSKTSETDPDKTDEKKAKESEEVKKLKEELEKAKKELDEINSKKDLKELNDKIDELRKEIKNMQKRRDGRREDRYDRYDRDNKDEENTEVKYEPIRGEFDEVDDNTLKKGEKAVVFYPIDGEKEITIETRIMNGLKVQRKSEKIIKKPQNGLVRIGTMTEEDKKTQDNQQNNQQNSNPQSTQAAVQGVNMTGVQNSGFVQNPAQTYPQGVPTSPDRTMNRTSTATTRYTFPVGDSTVSNTPNHTTVPSGTNYATTGSNVANPAPVNTSKEGIKYYSSSDEATQAAIAAINESNGAYKSYTIHQSPDGNYYYSLSTKASEEVVNQEAEKAQKQDVNLKTAANDPNTSKKLGAFLTMISSMFGAFFIFTKKRG